MRLNCQRKHQREIWSGPNSQSKTFAEETVGTAVGLEQWSPNYSRRGRSGCRFSFQPQKPHWLNCLCWIGWNKNLHPQRPSRSGLETSGLETTLANYGHQHGDILNWWQANRRSQGDRQAFMLTHANSPQEGLDLGLNPRSQNRGADVLNTTGLPKQKSVIFAL
ncbi:uncharacterized protein LOC144064430 [Stigmatopora argus]